MSFLKIFFSTWSRWFFQVISRRTTSIMRLLFDVHLSSRANYLESSSFAQLPVERFAPSPGRFQTRRPGGSHRDLLHLTAATTTTMYDAVASSSSIDVVAVSRTGFWVVTARWGSTGAHSRTDSGKRERKEATFPSDITGHSARKVVMSELALIIGSRIEFSLKSQT